MMNARRTLIVVVALTLTLAACSKAAPTGGASGGKATNGSKPATLTVWLMTGEIDDKTYGAVNTAFQAAHPGVTVNVQIQQWDGIGAKITAALGSNAPPDILEIGNTDVPEFAAAGGLFDLTGQKATIAKGAQWLTGLEAPATVDGKLYGVPLLAGDRVVLYNKDMFAKAGVSAPTSLNELIQAGAKLKTIFSNVPNFSPLYFPGKYWYAAIPLIWDAGGEIATNEGGTWKGALESPASIQGLQRFQQLQNSLSTPASRGIDTNDPDQDTVIASEKAAMIIGGGWELGVIEKDNPKLQGKIGAFAFPSATPGQSAPVFLGGSDIAVAAGSANSALAVDWITMMTSSQYQTLMYQNDGLMPNATGLLGVAASNPIQQVFFDAAKNSHGTPASPGWATIEADATMEGFFASIATGQQSIAEAAASTDAHLNEALNQG